MPFVTRSFAAGDLIAQKYLLLHLLGRGASGEVFRARNILAGNVLALKLLIEETGRDSELVQRFFREGRAINRISHPNIVSVFDAGYADAIPYIAMEYLSGESLAQVLDRIPKLPFACVAAILLKVLDALAAAHKADIVHRDLKPANVFLQACSGAPPRVKLLDFGVAKIHEDGESSIRTESGMILGTPDYLSPEQITADGEVDGRSDLFAAGSLMFELLTGRRPFHGPTFVTTTYRIVHEPVPSLAESGGPDDPDVAQILARALCKKRDERFTSAAEFAHHLEKIAPDDSAREHFQTALCRAQSHCTRLAYSCRASEAQALADLVGSAHRRKTPPQPSRRRKRAGYGALGDGSGDRHSLRWRRARGNRGCLAPRNP